MSKSVYGECGRERHPTLGCVMGFVLGHRHGWLRNRFVPRSKQFKTHLLESFLVESTDIHSELSKWRGYSYRIGNKFLNNKFLYLQTASTYMCSNSFV